MLWLCAFLLGTRLAHAEQQNLCCKTGHLTATLLACLATALLQESRTRALPVRGASGRLQHAPVPLLQGSTLALA